MTQSHAAGAALPDRIADALLLKAVTVPIDLEFVPNAGRRFDTPYTLFTPAWLLLALASRRSARYATHVVALVRYLLQLQQSNGSVNRLPDSGDADLYAAGQFALALRAALQYLDDDVYFDTVTLNRPPSLDFAERYDVAVMCALHEPEFAALVRCAPPGVHWSERAHDDSHTFWAARVPTKGTRNLDVVASVPTVPGPVAMAVLTTKTVLRFRPKIVMMVGIAAGTRSPNRGFGDILVARESFDYNSGKLVVDSRRRVLLVPDPQPINIDAGLLSSVQATKGRWEDEIKRKWPGRRPKTGLEVHVGPIASGSAVVAAPQVVAGIERYWRKLIGVEMEVYSMYRAVHETIPNPPLFLAVKSVCDFADDKKNDNWQDYAAFTSAEYFYRLLTELIWSLPAFH
jgi:nucleoside phosphorylase